MTKKVFKTIASLAFLTLTSSISYAGTVDEVNAQLESLATISGSYNEGEIEVTSRKCRLQDLPPQVRDGKYRSFLTYASGRANSYYNSSNGKFTVSAPYSCRIRTRIVSGCGGVQTNTDDNNVTSSVSIEVSVGFDGYVNVISKNLGGYELCGKSVADKAVARLNGAKLDL